MSGIGLPEIVFIMLFIPLVLALGLYFVVRQAVSHGTTDAQRRAGSPPRDVLPPPPGN